MTLKLGPNGRAYLKGLETGGYRDGQGRMHLLAHGEPALTAYVDDVGVWTIGWGHTRGVKPGMTITRAQAEALFAGDIASAEACISHVCEGHPTTQGQADGMIILAFNIGNAAFLGSTVLRKHLAGDHDGAAAAFAAWDKGHVHGALVVLDGLVKRRAAEARLYKGLTA